MDRHRCFDVDVGTFPAPVDYAVRVTPENESGRRCPAGFLQFEGRVESNHIVRIVALARVDDGLDSAADVSVAGKPPLTFITEGHAVSRYARCRFRPHQVITDILPEGDEVST